MTSDTDLDSAPPRALFPARLALGAAQGLVLYLLYRAADGHVWPATEPGLFAPLFLIALYVPLLISQAMSTMRLRTLLLWALIAAIACSGLAVYDRFSHPAAAILSNDDLLPQFSLFFFAFAGLFIAQSLIAGGDTERKTIAAYSSYFDAAWKLGVQLALSAVFAGVFWGVLWLGAALFNLIKLDFLEKLIEHEWFAIPATALATAAAIHLTDVRARLVAGIRGVVLTLLGWLLPLMALIAAGFLIGLFFTGFAPLWETKAAAAGLLGASAALVILINAAYQNGESERPALLRIAELVASFALVPLVLIAAYALSLRVGQYGWTVDRIVTLACILAALCYAVGYAAAAILSLLGRSWMRLLRPVNIATSFVVIALLLVLFTPVADPMRLSANSQIARLQEGRISAARFDYAYLKRETGVYGARALNQLAASRNFEIAKRARYALAANSSQILPTQLDLAQNITVYPKGSALPPSFLKQDWRGRKDSANRPACLSEVGTHCDAIVTGLSGNRNPDVILVMGSGVYWFGTLMRQGADGTWRPAATLPSPHCKGDLDALRAGTFKIEAPVAQRNRLTVQGRDIAVNDLTPTATSSCPR